MNSPQKKLVLSWVGLTMVIAPAFAYGKWLQDYWSVLQFPALIIFVVFMAITRPKYDSDAAREMTLRPYRRYPFLKACFAVYGVCLAALIIYIFTVDGHLIENWNAFELVLLVAPLLLPSIVVSEWDKFRALSEPSGLNVRRGPGDSVGS